MFVKILYNYHEQTHTKGKGDIICTRIVIAHRLSTIKNCDRILYMEHGEILEEGTYDELIEKKGRFFELIEGQRVDN
ncbi:MAG: hypothetical protein K6F14_01615 [Clostridiales bacterium]|nr:hypothetical protein [Clostridiales bacterium]